MANLAKTDRITLGKDSLTENFDRSVLENISWSYRSFQSHREIAAGLRNQNPYTVTILIENLDHKLWNKGVILTIISLYGKKTAKSRPGGAGAGVPAAEKQTAYYLDQSVIKRLRKGGSFLKWVERDGIPLLEVYGE